MTDSVGRVSRLRENVYNILEEYPNTRNDDRLLIVKYWELIDDIPFDATFPGIFVLRGTSPESITRARRHIQRQGIFGPTDPAVRDRRRQSEEQFRQHYAAN